MTQCQFPSITSLNHWAKNNSLQFLDGDTALPYVQQEDKQYYYFALIGKDYVLVMVASKDLGEPK